MGAQLKAIRLEQTNLSLEQAAKLLQWSLATMSRIENGKRHISSEDVGIILTAYQAPKAQRDGMMARAKAIDEPGWWSRPLPGVPDNTGALASQEAAASRLTDWSINLIPGLLQTYEYAKTYMLDDGVPFEDIETRWMARLRRQQQLPQVDYTAYIGEAAIRTPFGGLSAHLEQLKRLIEANHRGVGIRLVPEHRPHAALLQSWMFLEFPDSPPIVHVELLRSAVYLHGEEAAPYADHRAKLNKIALSAAETHDMLGRVVQRREAR